MIASLRGKDYSIYPSINALRSISRECDDGMGQVVAFCTQHIFTFCMAWIFLCLSRTNYYSVILNLLFNQNLFLCYVGL
jgi:hypothetical protein